MMKTYESAPNERINWPEFEPLIVLTQRGKYLGTGYINGDYLTINPDDGFAWEIPLNQITHVLNISDPCFPPSYYRYKGK